MKKQLPSRETLLRLIDYDENSGVMTWKKRIGFSDRDSWFNKRFAGRTAFSKRKKDGYLIGSILGTSFLAHRVIWKMKTGDDPEFIDHINGVTSDNRWENLRSVTHRENCKNQKMCSSNKSGFNGVSWKSKNKKWVAQGTKNGKRVHLGLFAKKEEAVDCVMMFQSKYGFHKNHGRVKASFKLLNGGEVML